MLLKKWEDLPSYMKCDEVRTYYDILSKRKISLVLKRFFDVVVASIMLIILAIPMAVIAVMIKFDSHGPVFYRQERVTTYGKHFRIHILMHIKDLKMRLLYRFIQNLQMKKWIM